MPLFLLILAVITYYVVKQSATPITRTPIWLLWLVLMLPATLWTTWALIYGEDADLPVWLIFGPFLVCPMLYWWLVQKGRIEPSEAVKQDVTSEAAINTTEAEQTENPGKVRPIDATEEKSLRDCFPWGVYYLQQLDYRPQAILCRGKLQVAPEMAYERVKGNVEDVFGDRFLVLFQESLQGQPFFALVPNPEPEKTVDNDSEPLTKPWLAMGLLLLTGFTTTFIGAAMTGVMPEDLENGFALIIAGIPYSLAIMGILGCHEMGHYMAAVTYKIRTTLPYFIPIPFFLGTFGAFIQMKSPVPNRKALFDVAIAGPLAGLVMALPVLWWGLTRSEVVPLSDSTSLLNFDALDPRFSSLMSLISKAALGAALEPEMVLDLHPVAIAGYIGLIVTALNLMPFGQLDGGHIIHAMLGQRAAIITGQLTWIFMVVFSLVRQDFLLWAIILLLMPVGDQPALNDVSELDDRRDFLGIVAIAILLMILLPIPPPVAQWLNI